MRKMLFWLSLFFGILFGIFFIKMAMGMWMGMHYKMPPTTISASAVKKAQWQFKIETIGTLSAINGVDLSAETAGIVSDILFESGQVIPKGQVILKQDTSVEEAQLANKLASLKLAQLDFDREQKLLPKNATSKQSYDTRLAQLQQAQADVDLIKAQIKQKSITTPFAGKLGIRHVNLGQYLSPGTMIVTLQAINPLLVKMNIPEQYLDKLKVGQTMTVHIQLDNTTKTIIGKLSAINAKADSATHNIQVEGLIENAAQDLLPNLFSTVEVWLDHPRSVLLVPETAISYSLSGDYVYLIQNQGSKTEPNLIANRAYVKTGEHRGDQVEILYGVQAGDLVADSGQLKLQNGASVILKS